MCMVFLNRAPSSLWQHGSGMNSVVEVILPRNLRKKFTFEPDVVAQILTNNLINMEQGPNPFNMEIIRINTNILGIWC